MSEASLSLQLLTIILCISFHSVFIEIGIWTICSRLDKIIEKMK